MHGRAPLSPSGVPGLSPTQVRAPMLALGWSVLPIRTHGSSRPGAGKAPGPPGWQRFAQFEASPPTLRELATWQAREHDWPGTGIPGGTVVAIDLDFATDAQLAADARALAMQVFGETPFERQGQAPKVALVYRAAEPMASHHLKTADGSGDGVDVIAEGVQLVAFGVHARTLEHYHWIGVENPLTAGPEAAPEITAAQVDEFLRRLGGLVELNSTGGRAGRRGGTSGGRIVRDASGRVIDGREFHLTRRVYAAARAMKAEGVEITVDDLVGRAWEAFAASTVLDDGRWGLDEVRVKARALIERVRRGAASLDGEEIAEAEPTYPDRRVSVAEAERTVSALAAAFFGEHVPAHKRAVEAWALADEAAREEGAERPERPRPTSWVARVEPAIGKSAIAISASGAAAATGLRIVYAMPTHALGVELAKRYAAQGSAALVYRGYEAEDPELPGQAMCLDLPAMRDAREAGVASIAGAVCDRKGRDGKRLRCGFHGRCGMTRQRAANPEVWIVPHALLHSARPEFIPEPHALIIDEGITMGAIPDRAARFSLDAMQASDAIIYDGPILAMFESNDLEAARGDLVRALRDHDGDGPVKRDILARHNITEKRAASAYRSEWRRALDPEIEPGMDPKARRERAKRTAAHNLEVKMWAGIWAELRAFLTGHAAASGRLSLRLDPETGARNVERRSLGSVQRSWSAPALLLDATAPDPALITPVLGHPVELKADVAARWSPHGKVRQIIGAPITATKLGIVEGREPEVERRVIGDLRRLIQLRAALVHQARTVVVIGSQRLVEKLVAAGLPANVETGHFGAISGIDRWSSAAGLICVGRMLPGPRIVEPLAGVITGQAPEHVAEVDPASGGAWYDPLDGGLRLATGKGVRVRHCQHPDRVAEALRWQICEAGVIQAIGRLRALRRTADNPFFLDIVSDVPLPVTIDQAVAWSEAAPGAWASMATEGVLLTGAADVMACFPDLAPTEKIARRITLPTFALTSLLELNIDVRANVRRAVYKRQGRYSPATAILLPNAPADLRGWLTARLGPLDSLTIEDVTPPRAQRESAPETPRSSGAADCAADLVARFRLVAATPPAPFCPRPIQAEVVTWRPPRPGSLAFSRPLARWGVPFQHAAE